MYKIMSNNISDYEAVNQIIEIDKTFPDNNITIMPDFHAGKGCVVGTTMKITDKVCVNHVGVDIGCGVAAYKIPKDKFLKDRLEELDNIIRESIPSGLTVRDKSSKYIPNRYDLKLIAEINDYDRVYRSLGSLGGGNHFIEMGENSECYMLFIHSGSRNLGVQVAKYWHNIAVQTCNLEREENLSKLIKTTKPEDREMMIKKYKENNPYIQKESCYLTGANMENYLKDMKTTSDYAQLNRLIMMKTILDSLKIPFIAGNYIECKHNYIDNNTMILRKGAISAKKGEKVIIPINMRDGIIIGVGKGNKDWNYSAPHGAGRVLSRSEAKQSITLEEFQNSMEGIFTTSVNVNTIDESPMAYKPMEEILDVIGDTIEVLEIVKPIYNFKAGE